MKLTDTQQITVPREPPCAAAQIASSGPTHVDDPADLLPGVAGKIRLRHSPQAVRDGQRRRDVERTRSGAVIASLLLPGAGQLIQGRYGAAALMFFGAAAFASFAMLNGSWLIAAFWLLTALGSVVDAATFLRR